MQTRHLTGPGELIAAIPFLLNRTPREEVVAVGMETSGEIVIAFSVERRDTALGESATSVRRAMAARLRRVGASQVFLVSYTLEDVSLACPAVEALRSELETAVERIEVWACDGERFFSPGCADPTCCPPGGRPVPRGAVGSIGAASASAVAHAAPDDGDAPAPSALRRSAARAADRWALRRDADAEQWRCESWQRLAESFPADAGAPVLGRAIAGLQDVRVRDALIVEWLGGSGEAVADTLLGRESAAVTEVLDGAMRDPLRAPPSEHALVASLRWSRRLVAHARRAEQAPVLALSAVILWWSGDLSAAERAARSSLRRDPTYSLARLIHEVALAKIAPAWTRVDGHH